MVASIYVNTGSGGGGGASMPDVLPFKGSVTSVPPNSETTVVSRVVPGGFAFKLYGIVVSGAAAAEWILYDNAVEVLRGRTSPAERGKDLLAGRSNALSFLTGHTVLVAVIHQDIETIAGSTSRNFYATLLGRDA